MRILHHKHFDSWRHYINIMFQYLQQLAAKYKNIDITKAYYKKKEYQGINSENIRL
jgi:hypothetical protein